MKDKCYIFLSDENKYGTIYEVLLDDVLNQENVYYLERTFVCNGKLFNIFKKIMFSTVLNKKFKEIPSRIAYRLLSRKYALKKEINTRLEQYEEVKVIFFNASIKRYYSTKVLRNLKNTDRVHFIMFFMDPTSIFASESVVKIIEEEPCLFEQIYTVDKQDSKDRGWIYWPTPYSKVDVSKKEKYDLYFCGATKNRHKLIIDLIEIFKEKGINTKWDVFYIKKKERQLSELQSVLNIKSIEHMLCYRETIECLNQSQCILELITEGQSATFTLRDYEAVVYNKKLLTNNKKIFEFPYYDERFMKYFENINDIDFNWIKNPIDVEYNYKGEYSPTNLIERIG